MKLTQEQLQKASQSVTLMTNGFRDGKYARSYKEYKASKKKLFWAGPRMIRNCKMLIDEIYRLWIEREVMVEALKWYANERRYSDMTSDTTYELTKSDRGERARNILKQVGELE